ncbi:50S ribosomal protein L11 methyltransferase [Salinicola tamaricis]|uniref:50S ribosomal protein L11 methyltransferase n=1 Tax=Salinicola tamaricis TaxID=1771309 RepID=UPI00241454DC|nr:50S ribosomal protein L11 methyltransferase [Salinicola tamaricis]
MLDYGCGSGFSPSPPSSWVRIPRSAVDIDPQALQASRDNAERNQLDDSRLLLEYPERLGQGRFEVVVANILAGPLIELAAEIADRVAPGGRLALSGILAAQADSVLDAYRDQGLRMAPPQEKEGWVLLSGERPAA